MPLWQKIALWVFATIAVWGFTTSFLWGITEPIWKWTKRKLDVPYRPDEFAEIFAIFWPFMFPFLAVVVAFAGPVLAGEKLRKLLFSKKKSVKKSVTSPAVDEPGPEQDDPTSPVLVLTPELRQVQEALKLKEDEIWSSDGIYYR